jgi:hypothetical protein
MFMVGFLKFFNPFKGWYIVQVANSGLGDVAYWMGITGELIVGTTLILGLTYQGKVSTKLFYTLLIATSGLVIVMMTVGFYVHLHPNVPAEVLPLKIKPPFIPGMFLALGAYNIYLIRKHFR